MIRNFKDDREFYSSLPRKRIGVGALLFHQNKLLIVQPTYSPGWIIPGGTVEAEESPIEALHREIREEVNLRITPTELLAVDYVHNRDVRGEYVQLLFAAKDLLDIQLDHIELQEYELKNYDFVEIEKAYTILTPAVSRRVQSALEAHQKNLKGVYLEDGRLLYDLKLGL